MFDGLLSVVIPVYNNGIFLTKCLKSVIEQTFHNIEIILIDDGSTDDSMEICNDYEKKYSNIKFYHTSNSGPYQARKYGASKASGRLITFLDADDWIEKDAYEMLINIFLKHEPDIISYTFQIDDSGNAEEDFLESGLYTQEMIKEIIIPRMMFDIDTGWRKLNPSVGCKIFKKEVYLEVVDKIEERIVWGEDALVTYPAMCIADSVYIYNQPFYHYNMNDNSCTHSFPYERIGELKDFKSSLTKLLIHYCDELDLSFQVDCYLRTYVEMLANNWLQIHRSASMHVFPYNLVRSKANVSIYGAGEVGKSYIVELLQSRYANVAGWYDKEKCGIDYCGISIQNPKFIDEDAECIIIAVADEKVAYDIRGDLIKEGMSKEKIFWEKPVLKA